MSMMSLLNWLAHLLCEARLLYAVNHENWRDAVRHCNNALRLKPNNVDVLGIRGVAQLSLGNYAQAIADFSQALRIKPMVDTYINRAIAFRNDGKFEDALADCNEALRLRPQDNTIYIERAQTYRQSGNLEQAVIDFKAAIENDEDPDYYRQLAETQVETNDWDGALQSWQRALEICPDDGELYFSRGKAYAHRGDMENANKDFESVKKSPYTIYEWVDTYVQLASFYQDELKDYDKALEYLAELGKSRVTKSFSLFGRGAIYICKRDYSTALRETLAALDYLHHPQLKRMILNNLGVIFGHLGNLDQAHIYLEQAIALNPEYPSPYGNRSALHLKQNRFAEALADAETAYKLKPDEPDILAGLAVAHYAAGNVEKSLELWHVLLKLEPNYSNVEWIKTEKVWFEWTLPYAEAIIKRINDSNEQRITNHEGHPCLSSP
jgi:tetratricopeptide (TPR) repeat protein